jgi:integrase
MARVNQRLWRILGQRAKRKAWGYTVQIPCTPCPHLHAKTGQALHPNGFRQVRSYRAEWTQDDAENELAKALLKIEPPKPVTGGITLAQAVDRYLAAKARKRTVAEDKRQFAHIKAAFGAATPLAEITPARISEYKASRLGTKSQRTGRRLTAAAVNRPLALLRHLLRLAHEEWEELEAVPRIRLEKEPQGRIRWLQLDEERRLLDACRASRTKHLARIVIVAMETGLRRGELLGLTWDRVDLSRGVLRLEQTKSGKRREVPMRQVVYDVLAPLRAKALEGLTPGPDGRLPELDGRVWPVGDVRTAFENAVAQAKLDDFHFHDLRHHFASWYIMRGGSLPALQQILGHADIKMTLRYAHLAPEHLRAEMAKTERPVQRGVESTSPSAQRSAQDVARKDTSEVPAS